LVLAAQNNGPLLAFARQAGDKMVYIKPMSQDAALEATYIDGRLKRLELGYGSGYLSQSGRNAALPREGLKKVILIDFRGRAREVAFQ
jgi:hypothetical protein